MARWFQVSWWASESRWFHVERPFPWLLLALSPVAVLCAACAALGLIEDTSEIDFITREADIGPCTWHQLH